MVQKHSGLEMSRASVTPLRIVRLGVITRTRPLGDAERQRRDDPGLAAPDRDHDDRRVVGFREVLADGPVRIALRLAQQVVRLDVRVRGGEDLAPGGGRFRRPAVFQPERLEVGPPVVAVAAARPADRGEPAIPVPPAQRLGRDPDIVGRLGDLQVVLILTHEFTVQLPTLSTLPILTTLYISSSIGIAPGPVPQVLGVVKPATVLAAVLGVVKRPPCSPRCSAW